LLGRLRRDPAERRPALLELEDVAVLFVLIAVLTEQVLNG
jgi:hypothetical protein